MVEENKRRIREELRSRGSKSAVSAPFTAHHTGLWGETGVARHQRHSHVSQSVTRSDGFPAAVRENPSQEAHQLNLVFVNL